MTPPLLVTRAAEEAEPLVARLRAEGVDAIAAPCLRFVDEPPDRSQLGPLAAADADLLVTSPRSLPALRVFPPPARWRVLALAPSTAARLREAGVRVDEAVEGGAAALAARARPGPVVFATSDLGGEEVWRVRPDAVRWVTYRTEAPDDLPAPARAALAGGAYAVLATSPSALRHLERLAPGAVTHATHVLCHGATTLREAERLGGRAVPWRLPEGVR